MDLQNMIFKNTILLIIFVFSFSSLNGQDCIDYPEIEGAPCKDCAPAGWTNDNLFLYFTHIIPPVDGLLPQTTCTISDISGPSPRGGNVVLLIGSNGWVNTTTLETEITGLDPNITYTFGIYWEGITGLCASSTIVCVDGILRIEIDEEVFEFEGATEWELAEVCFKPTSSSAYVKISSTTPSSAGHSKIIVDGNFDCSIASQCCTIEPAIEDDNHVLCPGEVVVFDADYSNEIGSVQVEWSCEPSEGLNYLSSINEISPEFVFPIPSSDFDGKSFEYTLSVEDDICLQTIESIEVEVLPYIAPQFDLELCDLDLVAQLPTEAINGYTGVWEGNFNIEFEGGNTIPYTFALDPGQNNCTESYTYEIFVKAGYTPTFIIEETYCLSDSTTYVLPNESEQQNSGQWFSTNTFSPSSLGEGIHTFWFEPYTFIDHNFCVTNYELNIEVISDNPFTFDLPSQFCVESEFFVLPNQSIEGIFGTWTEDSIDLSIPVQDGLLLFIPDEGNLCNMEYIFEYSVSEYTTPLFTIEEYYCSNDTSFTLPEISNDSISGNWNVDFIDPSIHDSLSITFTPSDEGCYALYSQTLYFTKFKDPIFDLPEIMCSSDSILIFPEVSENGVNGSWTQNVLDPSVSDLNTFNNTFTPDDSTCTSTFSVAIEILSFENVSIEVVDPSSCAVEDGSINIWNGTAEMQLSIDNGMTWTAIMNINNLSSGVYDILLRYEVLPSCSAEYSLLLNSPDSPMIQELIVVDPSSCGQTDGSIECIMEGNDLEYSIDNTVWQASNIFENLAQGGYVIYVRLMDQNDCVSSFLTELEDPISMEVCDGIDNNCNGEIDENLPIENYYADNDMDGFGNLNDMISSCFQPAGYVLDHSDCDDTDENINPNAMDICDGTDNNCDGETDENLPIESYYADNDMDGFGNINDSIVSCFQPDGYVLDHTDCDDMNSDINPGAMEILNNGIDENCDGEDLITSVYDLSSQNIAIFPNPTQGIVTIEMEEDVDVVISLYNLKGDCLKKEISTRNIDLSELPNGIYLLKITNLVSLKSIVERIILIH